MSVYAEIFRRLDHLEETMQSWKTKYDALERNIQGSVATETLGSKSSRELLTPASSAEASGQPSEKQTSTNAIWTEAWVLENPDLAVRAISHLQHMVKDLEDQLKEAAKKKAPIKQFKHGRVRLYKVPVGARFYLERTGQHYIKTDRKSFMGNILYEREDGSEVSLHGLTYVQVVQ